MTGTATKIALGSLASVLLALAVLGVADSPSQPAYANPTIALAVDTDTTGNGASILGANDDCIAVSSGTEVDIDITGQDMAALIAFSVYLSYDGGVVNVIGNNVSMRLSAGNLSNVFDASEQPGGNPVSPTNPDSDGFFRAEAADISDEAESHPDGSGVLSRVTVKAVGAGVSPLAISGQDLNGDGIPDIFPILTDFAGAHPGNTDGSPDGSFDEPITDAVFAVDQPDTDGDGLADPCDPDIDNDGILDDGDGSGIAGDNPCSGGATTNCDDNCPTDSNPGQEDADGDGVGDACETDTDNDGLDDVDDPCPVDPDCDSDTISDGPGDPDGAGPIQPGPDNCINDANTGQEDLDGDGVGDACETDTDGDGFPDTRETARASNPLYAGSTPEVCDGIDNDLDTETDEGLDFDSNGIPDCTDPNADTDGDLIPNDQDDDCDDDGKPNSTENFIATHACKPCPSDSADEAWWADMDNNTWVNILDVVKFRNPFFAFAGDPTYEKRVDLNPNGVINILDVVALRDPFGTNCTP